MAGVPGYLKPYLDAARVHGDGFPSLLWASPITQLVRFDAFSRAVNFQNCSVLDVGCGRGDLYDFLKLIGRRPSEYIGIEAVPELANAVEAKGLKVIRKDFIADPLCLFTASDIVTISGAINTCPDDAFFTTIHRAWDATAHHLVFNFLSSKYLAGADHLFWRDPEAVDRFCRNTLSVAPVRFADYLEGDMTFVLTKKYA